MATDKRLDQVSTLTDFDYALIVKGDQVAKASKQQLAELVGNLLYGATNASSLATVVAEQMNPIRNVGVNIPSNDLNEIKDDLLVIIPSVDYIALTNRPPIDGYFIFLSTSRKVSADYAQIAVDYNTGQIYTRKTGNSWIKVGLE